MMKKEMTAFLLVFFIVLLTFIFLRSRLGSKSSIKVFKEGNRIVIKRGEDIKIIELYDYNIIRVNYLPKGEESQDTLVIQGFQTQVTKKDFEFNSGEIELNGYRIKINEDTGMISIFDDDNKLILKEDEKNTYKDKVKFIHNAGDNFYGIDSFNVDQKSNFKLILRNSGGNAVAGKQGHAGGPFVWSTSGYGILVDSDSEGAWFDINDEYVEFLGNSKRDFEYFVFFGEPKDIFRALFKISGRYPLFPKWSMGFMNTEWGIDEKELMETIDTYRKKEIPIDAFILDFDWKAWGEELGEFRWNQKKFPNGQNGRLAEILRKKGIKLAGIFKPRIHIDTKSGKFALEKGYFVGKKPYEDYFSKKLVNDLDFSKEEVRKWFFENAKEAFDSGIIGYWNDEADEVNNTQFLNMQRALYEGQRAYTNKRVWSLNRNFFLGSQRYSYGIWSGDIDASSYTMAAQRERLLSSVNVGAVKWGMDTGGFRGEPSEETYIRWVQFSAFTPIFRVHGDLNQQRQPWVFGKRAEDLCREAIRLRYKLIPYIYSYERKLYDEGFPLVRPLVFDYPKDKNVINYVDAWMFGEYLLVSPVVEEGQIEKQIYLPEGEWIDYFKGTVYKGGQNIKYRVNLDTLEDIPLFIKRGAIIPTQDVVNYVEEKKIENIYLDIFPDYKWSFFDYYDDDGETYNYEKGEYFKQRIGAIDNKDHVEINISEKEGNFEPPLKYYFIRLHRNNLNEVKANDISITKLNCLEELLSFEGEGYFKTRDKFGEALCIKINAGLNKNIIIK